MAFPQIGLQAVLQDAEFKKGLSGYLSGIEQMDSQTSAVSENLTDAFSSAGQPILQASEAIEQMSATGKAAASGFDALAEALVRQREAANGVGKARVEVERLKAEGKDTTAAVHQLGEALAASANADKDVARIKTELQSVQREAAKASQELKGMSGGIQQTGNVMASVGKGISAALSLAVVGTAVNAVKDLYELGAQAQRVENAFTGLQGGAGAAADSLEILRTAARGTISDTELMLAANRAQLLGVADNANDLAGLMQVAEARGKAMGMTTAAAFGDIVTGVGRLSPMILDNLGIVVNAEASYAKYAKQLGITADALTDAQKKQALVNGIMESSAPLLAAQGKQARDAAGDIEAMGSAWANLRANLGQTIAAGASAGGASGMIENVAGFIGRAKEANLAVAETKLQLKALREEGVLTAWEYDKLKNAAEAAGTSYRYNKQTVGELQAAMQALSPALVITEEKKRSLAAASDLSAAALRNETVEMQNQRAVAQQATAVEGEEDATYRAQRDNAIRSQGEEEDLARFQAYIMQKRTLEQQNDAATLSMLQTGMAAIATLESNHATAMEAIERGHNEAVSSLRMNYLDQKAEAEGAYQQQYHQMLELGMKEEAAKLTTKHTEETAQNDANYQKQLQLQQIANIKQQIEQQRSYAQALRDQQDAARRDMMARIQKALDAGQIEEKQAEVLLQVAAKGASEKLKKEIEYAKKALNISKGLADGQVETAKGALEALLAVQDQDIAAADAAMAKLTADLDKMMGDLIANTAVSTAGLAAVVAPAATAGAKAAAEPATKTLAQVSSDINNAIKAIREAIKNAPSVIWTPATEAAFDKVGEAIKAAVTKVYGWLSEKPGGGSKSVGDMAKDMQKQLAPVAELMKLLSTDTSKWKNTNETFFDDLLDLVGKLKFASAEVYKWMALIDKDTRKALEEAQPAVANVKALFALLDVDLSKAVPGGAGWHQNAYAYIGQLKWLSARIYEWMMAMAPEARANLDLASSTAASLKGLFVILGVELGKAVPEGGDWFERAWRWYGQMRWFSGVIYTWIMEMDTDTQEAVGIAASVAKNLKELFGLLGIDLAKAVPVMYRFHQKAWAWYGQMRWISARIYEWMLEIGKMADVNLAAAAGVAKNVKELFVILDVDLAKILPIEGVSWRRMVTLYFDQLKELGRQIMNWLGYLSDDTRAQVKKTAETAGHVKEMFEIFGVEFEDVKPIGAAGIARMMLWLGDLKALFAQMMPALVTMNDDWGDALEIVSLLVEKIAAMFSRIDEAAQAIASARKVGGLHIGTARALLNQLMGIMSYINALSISPISLPPLVGGAGYVGGGPSDVALTGGASNAAIPWLATSMQSGFENGASWLSERIVSAIRDSFDGTSIEVRFNRGHRGDVVETARIGNQTIVNLALAGA